MPDTKLRWFSLGRALMIAGALLLSLVTSLWLQAQLDAQAQAQTRTLTISSPAPLALPPLTVSPTISPTAASAKLSPPVRLQIPRLGVDRAVVPLTYKPDAQGNLTWDTDSLFATVSRPDLVGHLISSANPGAGDNVVLSGHNYNRGRSGWRGVFVNLTRLQVGDPITVTVAGGEQFAYRVQQVTSVPWRNQSDVEWQQHQVFLGSTNHEQLTLVTCGGANLWPFPARVYVVAAAAAEEEEEKCRGQSAECKVGNEER